MATTDIVTNESVNRRYWPKSGTTNEVGGIISMRQSRKTSTESTIDMVKETCCRVRNYPSAKIQENNAVSQDLMRVTREEIGRPLETHNRMPIDEWFEGAQEEAKAPQRLRDRAF